jgi:hypothetical protein
VSLAWEAVLAAAEAVGLGVGGKLKAVTISLARAWYGRGVVRSTKGYEPVPGGGSSVVVNVWM